MTKFKKIIVYITTVILSLGNIFPSIVFAHGNSEQENTTECYACKATPVAMQTFINFEVELLGILQSSNGQAETFGTNKSSGLFAGGLLSLPVVFFKSTIEKTKKSLEDEIKAVRAARITTVLIATMSILSPKESLYSFEILFKQEAFVRDYKTLEELDLSINDIIWDMGVSGIRNDRVSPSIKNEILGLQSKYTQGNGNNAIFEMISISSDVKYKQLLLFVLKLNSIIKSMLMTLGENTPLLDSIISNFENEYSDGDIIIKINREYVESMKRDYSCVSYSTCNKTVKEALKGLLDAQKFSESFGRTKDTIKDANQNLKDVFITNTNNQKDDKKKGIGGLTDRQVELLYTVYGLDAHNLTTSQIETLKQNFEQIKKETQPLVDGFKDVKNTTKEITNTVSTTGKGISNLVKSRFNKIKSKGTEQENDYINGLTEQEKENLLQEIYRQKIIPLSDEEETFIKTMQNTVNEILTEKGKDKENLLVGINQDIHYFVEIGGLIHSIVNDEIGNKDGGLVKILGETCEYQCKNHNGMCYSK